MFRDEVRTWLAENLVGEFASLGASGLNYIGFVEGTDIFSGDVDVVVTDGFTGNVALKVSEGLVETMENLLRDELTSTMTLRVWSTLGAMRTRSSGTEISAASQLRTTIAMTISSSSAPAPMPIIW